MNLPLASPRSPESREEAASRMEAVKVVWV
jgi:hypothetical protein